MRIEINDAMQRQLALVGLDSRYVDVKLHDGRVLKKLVIREGWCITGRADDPNGEGNLPFQASDIKKIRRHSFLPFW
jgi:hypothetical protein